MQATLPTLRFDVQDDIAHVVFDQPDSLVNLTSAQWEDDMEALTAQLQRQRATLRGIVLTSAKHSFFAGCDLKALMRTSTADAVRFYDSAERLKKNLRSIEALGLPIVTLLNGSALGSGWELALTGHHRIAIAHEHARFGLPQSTLGLLPAVGGITKMTRHLGLEAAQTYLVDGKTFSAVEAYGLGLVHELVAPDDRAQETLLARALAWIASTPSTVHPWDSADFKIPGGVPSTEPLAGLLAGIEVGIRHKTRGWLPAPEAIFACMVQGLGADMESALKIESRHLAQLMIGNHARTLVNTYFFDLRAVKKGLARPACDFHFTPQRIGVLGANTLGTSLALLQSSQGYPTVLHDSSLDQAELGRRNVALLTQDQVNQGRISAQSQMAILERVVPTNYLPALGSCNVVIAAEPDTGAWRTAVRRELPEAERILATCTEGVVTHVATFDSSPKSHEDPVGLHFFLPVEASPVVEIVRRASTGATAVACAFDHAIAMGKLPLLVADRPGYFVGRVFASYCREGATMLAEGIPGQPIEIAGWQIGMALGPLAAMDDLTLADSLRLMGLTRQRPANEQIAARPCPGELLMEQMIGTYSRPGLPGCGFYELPVEPDRRKKLWPELTSLFVNLNTQWEFSEVKDRLLYRQSVEAARCIAEGVVGTAAEANIGSVYGAGFPAWTGGALQFVYAMGIEAFRQRADALATQFGEGFLVTDSVLDALYRHQPQY